MPAVDTGRPMGHEFLGVVEETGADVTGLHTGDLVVAPFTYSDNTCDYCARGLHISCRNGGRYGFDGVDGGQGEEGIARVREVTGGGVDKVIEAVGRADRQQ